MKKKMKSSWLGLFAVMTFSVSFAQETTNLSLKQCLSYSLEHNPNSTIYKNKAEIARLQNREVLATYLPQIAASAEIDANVKLQTSVIPAGSLSPVDVKITMGNPYSNNALVQLDQKIYDQSAIVGLKGMNVNKEIAALNILQNNESILYSVAQAYYQVQVLTEQEKLLQQNEEQYSKLLEIMQLQHEKGIIKKTDLDRTRVSVNNIKSQISVVKNNKILAINRLKVAIGMPVSEGLNITDTLENSGDLTLPADESFDATNRVDYQLAEKNILIQSLDVKTKRAAFVPTVSGFARYGAVSYSKEFRTSFNTWYDYSTIGLKVSIPIFSGLRRESQLQQSKITLENMKTSLDYALQNYQLEYENARAQLLSSYQNYLQSKDNMALAKDVYENVSLQYQTGQASLSDFLNSDYAYKEAQSNYTTSLLNFLSSRLDVEKAKGNLSNYLNQL